MQKTTIQNICRNNCEHAVKSFMTSYGSKCGDKYIDADYMWRCTIVDKIITCDSVLHQLGCGTYSNVKSNEMNTQAESLLNEVEQKLTEIEKMIPQTGEPVPEVPRTFIHAAKPEAPPCVKESIVDIIADNSELPVSAVTEIEKPATVAPTVVSEPVVEDPKKRKPRTPRAEPAAVEAPILPNVSEPRE
jgi:hypothetical protein